MAILSWVPATNLRYEQGVDRAVLYPMSGDAVAWNGIVAVTENVLGAEKNERYIDGVKYHEDVGSRHYQANVKAYSAPVEFEACLGSKAIARGVYLTGQPRTMFNFSYRTQIGTIGYKIHLVYNVTASPSGKDYSTREKTTKAMTFDWKFDAVGPFSRTHKSTAHFIVDSTKATPANLVLLEAMLYGTTAAAPSFPDMTTLINLFAT